MIALWIFLVIPVQKRTDVSTPIMRYFSLRSIVPQLLLPLFHLPEQILPQNAFDSFSNIQRYCYHLLFFCLFDGAFKLFQEPHLFLLPIFDLILLLHGQIYESNEILDGNFLPNFSGFSTIVGGSVSLGVLWWSGWVFQCVETHVDYLGMFLHQSEENK